MLAFRNNGNGTVFVEATQPPILAQTNPPFTVGVTLDESDLIELLKAVQGDPANTDAVLVIDVEPGESITEKLTADRPALAGDR